MLQIIDFLSKLFRNNVFFFFFLLVLTVIFKLKTMGRKDASTARTPVDQYRKQIGKRSEENFVCLKKPLFCAGRLVGLTKCIIFPQKLCVA